jgi:hypothetical protein
MMVSLSDFDVVASEMVLETGNDYCPTLRLLSIVCIYADEFLNKQRWCYSLESSFFVANVRCENC